jgi:hypothetical protein
MAVRMMRDKNFFCRLLRFLSIQYYVDSMSISPQRKVMLIRNHDMRSHYSYGRTTRIYRLQFSLLPITVAAWPKT